eukprot:UC4_evm1s426
MATIVFASRPTPYPASPQGSKLSEPGQSDRALTAVKALFFTLPGGATRTSGPGSCPLDISANGPLEKGCTLDIFGVGPATAEATAQTIADLSGYITLGPDVNTALIPGASNGYPIRNNKIIVTVGLELALSVKKGAVITVNGSEFIADQAKEVFNTPARVDIQIDPFTYKITSVGPCESYDGSRTDGKIVTSSKMGLEGLINALGIDYNLVTASLPPLPPRASPLAGNEQWDINEVVGRRTAGWSSRDTAACSSAFIDQGFILRTSVVSKTITKPHFMSLVSQGDAEKAHKEIFAGLNIASSDFNTGSLRSICDGFAIAEESVIHTKSNAMIHSRERGAVILAKISSGWKVCMTLTDIYQGGQLTPAVPKLNLAEEQALREYAVKECENDYGYLIGNSPQQSMGSVNLTLNSTGDTVENSFDAQARLEKARNPYASTSVDLITPLTRDTALVSTRWAVPS